MDNNHVHYNVWDEITYPFSNLNGCTVESWEWIRTFIPHFTVHVITWGGGGGGTRSPLFVLLNYIDYEYNVNGFSYDWLLEGSFRQHCVWIIVQTSVLTDTHFILIIIGGQKVNLQAKVARNAHIAAKHVAKHTVWVAKAEANKWEFATVSTDDDGVFRIAKQMDHTNKTLLVRTVYAMMPVSLRSLTKAMSIQGVGVSLCQSMAQLWLKWMSTAPCLMWKPLSAAYVVCCALVGAVTDAVWRRGSSGNSYMS